MPSDSRTQSVQAYLRDVEQALRAGNATEHTFRPALKALLEILSGRQVTATNEPRQIACGAPDFVVGVDGAPVGYLEAKDVGAYSMSAHFITRTSRC